MNWSLKKVALILLVLCMAFGLAADNSVFIGDGDVGSLKLYDHNGRPLDATMEDASEIGEGWILHNPGSDLLIVTPVGTANLYQDSLAITTELSPRDIEITLVRGKGTFRATELLGGSLTVSTPASRYTLRDEGELFVVTSDTEESITVFNGTVESYNLITREHSTIDSFEKLYMQDMSRTSETIQRGYFLTYGTYPTAPAPAPVMTPPATVTARAEEPKVSTKPAVEPPKAVQPVVEPIAEPAMPPAAVPEAPVIAAPVAESIVPVIEAAPAAPPAPPLITTVIEVIVEEPVAVAVEEPAEVVIEEEEPVAVSEVLPLLPITPSFVTVISEAIVEEPVEEEPAEVMEVLPLIPNAPSFVTWTSEAIVEEPVEEPAEVEEVLPPLPPAPSSITVSRELIAKEPVVVEAEKAIPIPAIPTLASPSIKFAVVEAPAATEEPVVIEEPAPVEEPEVVEAAVGAPRPALASSADQAKRSGSIGIEMGYEFTFDGTDSDRMNHRLWAQPYFSKGPFAIRLNAFIETEDFSDFPNSILPVPTDTLDLIGYIFTHIDHLRIGYETSAFYLVADTTRSMASEHSTFFAPNFGQSGRLMLHTKISIGAFAVQLSIDDLRLASMRDNQRQFSEMLVSFTNPKGYPVTVALGTLADGQKGYVVDLYPLLSVKLPIVNNRTTQFSALIQAQGYLPAYPTFDFDQFIDRSLPTFFPNYLLAGGFSLTHGGFSARILAALNKGENHNFLVNDFTYSDVDTAYDSTVDVLAELAWQGKAVHANLAMNLPFASSSFAKLTSGGHGADFTQFSIAVDIGDVNISLGLQQLGIIDTVTDLINGDIAFLELFAGEYAASYLSVSYTWAPFTFQVKASYPAKNSVFSLPIINVGAKVDLNKRF